MILLLVHRMFLSTRSVIISDIFVYFHWYKKNVKSNTEKDAVHVKFNSRTQTTIY